MKKNLLMVSAVLFASVNALAISTPQEFENYGFACFSPDGTIGVSYTYGNTIIYFTETGQSFKYTEEEELAFYAPGTGNCVSNNGVVVGQYLESNACYWRNGEWKVLNFENMSIANGVTPDGSRIVGSVPPSGTNGSLEGLMLVPCYWDAADDGTFAEAVELPHPSKDLLGRNPQYITAVAVANDGKTIAGQIVDYRGMIVQPILYTQNSKGEWSYTLLQENLYHPENLTVPAEPGECPEVNFEDFMSLEELDAYNEAIDKYYEDIAALHQPEMFEFMTPEEYEAYLEAYDKYMEDWENNPYPWIENYMTEEELNAYYEASDAYWEEYSKIQSPEFVDFMSEEELAKYYDALKIIDAWQEEWNAYEEGYSMLLEEVPNFEFNNVFLTGDGAKYISTYMKQYSFGWDVVTDSYPWVFDLNSNTYDEFELESIPLLVSSVTDNGTILAWKRASWTDIESTAYMLPAGKDEYITILDYYKEYNPEIADWMSKKMTHTIEMEEYDEANNTFVISEVEIMPTGIPLTNANMSFISLTVENIWDYSTMANSYLLPGPGNASVNKLTVDASAISVLPSSSLLFSGEFENAVMFDVNGYKVFEINNPNGEISTGLSSGIYVLKAKTANNGVTTIKVRF